MLLPLQGVLIVAFNGIGRCPMLMLGPFQGETKQRITFDSLEHSKYKKKSDMMPTLIMTILTSSSCV
jgi:hypothetical protein